MIEEFILESVQWYRFQVLCQDMAKFQGAMEVLHSWNLYIWEGERPWMA